MNKTLRFYALVHEFFTRQIKEDSVLAKRMRTEILRLAVEAEVSWNITEDHLEEMDKNDGFLDVSAYENLLLAAFKDLSSMRYPKAVQIFEALKKLSVSRDHCLVWAQKVIRKSNGSATIILQVSDIGYFDKKVSKASLNGGCLEKGLIFRVKVL